MSNEKNIFSNLMRFWPMIIFIGAVVMGYANLNSSVSNNTNRIITLEASDRSSRDAQNQMLIQLSQIQTDIQWIKDKFR